ncbi:MAG: efflux RND transporter permease subunit, partial [Proteobacteria bacterium]|nr:efflux RND transporter permease subunit [Pseudomonadota bacterium]
FIPLLLVGGVMGDVILTLPMVLLCIILASLVECFLVLPGHLKASLSNVKPTAPDSWRARFDGVFFRFRDQKFMPFVRRALDYPGATLCAATGGVIIAFSLMASQHVAFNLVTGFDFETLEAQVEFASTASDKQKEAFLDHLQERLSAVNKSHPGDNAQGWITKSNLAEFNEERLTGEQYASIQVFFRFAETRTVDPQTFVNEWQAGIDRPPYIEQITVGVAGGQNNGQADITLVLRGQDINSLKEGAEALSDLLGAYPGVSNVVDNLPYGREQIIFRITPTGRALGLTPAAIGSQLRAAYDGTRVQILNENLSELEVRVMLPDDERDHLGRLQQFPIRTLDGEIIPLTNAAQLYSRRGIDLIRHSNTQMAVQVSADVDSNINNAMAIIKDLKVSGLDEILNRHDLTFGLSGKSQQDEIIMQTMALGGILTLILIYLILAWVFSSYLWPLSIMMAIPFGFTGAVLGHWITGWDVGAMSMLAFFSLTGIVVNDSIVLISFLKRDVEAGGTLREALERAVSARYRAVLLTSLTTIAGLSPLMFETSSLAFYVAPLAVTICFGLAFSTLLVLIVIPAMILLLEAAKAHLRRSATSLISSAKGVLS